MPTKAANRLARSIEVWHRRRAGDCAESIQHQHSQRVEAGILAARRHLRELEDAQLQPGPQGDLFVAHIPNDVPPPHPALDQLREIDPDTLTPREALDALYRLKALLPDPRT